MIEIPVAASASARSPRLGLLAVLLLRAAPRSRTRPRSHSPEPRPRVIAPCAARAPQSTRAVSSRAGAHARSSRRPTRRRSSGRLSASPQQRSSGRCASSRIIRWCGSSSGACSSTPGNASSGRQHGAQGLGLSTGIPSAQAAAWRLIADSLRARGRNQEAAAASATRRGAQRRTGPSRFRNRAPRRCARLDASAGLTLDLPHSSRPAEG